MEFAILCKKILLGAVLAACFVLPKTISAANIGLPDPEYTPESPLYRFELLWDNIRSFFAYGHEKRAKLFLGIALERLAEARELTGRNVEGTEWATGLYRDEMTQAHREAQKSRDAGLLAELAQATNEHMPELDRISERTPFDRKLFATRAKEYAVADQTDTLRVLFDVDPKKALDIWRESIAARLKRIVLVAGDEENIVEVLREYEKYALFASKLMVQGQKITIDGATIREIIQRSTQSHEAVLQGIRKKIKPLVVEQYLRSINAVRAVQDLSQLQRLDEVPEDAPEMDVPSDSDPDGVSDDGSTPEIIPDESLPGDLPQLPSVPGR